MMNNIYARYPQCFEEIDVENIDNHYNLKKESLADKYTSDSFVIDHWKTDDTYSAYIVDDNGGKHLFMDCFEGKDIDELIYVLSQIRKGE